MIARRKGIVSEKDRRKRLQYARKMKHELSRNPDFFKHDIAFYLDGVSFVHKHNPLQAAAVTKSRIWRKKNEGLQFTAKGSRLGWWTSVAFNSINRLRERCDSKGCV